MGDVILKGHTPTGNLLSIVADMVKRDDWLYQNHSKEITQQLQLLDEYFGETPLAEYSLPPKTIGGLFRPCVFARLMNALPSYDDEHKLHFFWN